jgi:predicted nucleic acid-binding protein
LALEEDGGVASWWSTPAECWSALARLRREETISLGGETAAHHVLNALRGSWLDILPSEPVRDTAKRLLRSHSLRAAAALQLAVAAELEGFRVVTLTKSQSARRGRVR